MQRQVFSIGLSATLFLLLIWLGWGSRLGSAPAAVPRVVAVSAAAPTGMALATPRPSAETSAELSVEPLRSMPATVRLDVHVEADANGEGSAHVVASSQGGQALAHIDTKGQASGHAQADAPALVGCTVCGGVPLEDGQRTEDRETEDRRRPSEEGTKAEDRGQSGATPSVGEAPEPQSGQVVVLVEANLRSGPSLGSGVIGGAHAGDRWAVSGRSADGAWWRVCCTVGNQTAWLYAALAQWVDPLVPLPALVILPPPNLPGSAELAERQGGGTVTAPTATATATPWAFAIVEQEQHSEANYATLYVWIQDGHGVSLEGYRLLVTKDGAPLTMGAVRSTATRQGTTRPSAAGGPEDKPYNLKLAFDPRVVGQGFVPAGAWTVQLLDPQGQPAAVVALFALRTDDERMEMYLNYGRR